MHSGASFWQLCKYSFDGAQTLISFELSAKVLTRTRRRNINTDRLGLKLSPVRAKQPLLFWGSSSEPPWLDLSEEPRRVFVVKQCECLCVYVLEGEYEVGCCEVGWEFDGLRCHLPLCDLRCRGCWRARGSKQAGRGVFHTELAFMKNTGTALPTAPPSPPWRMEKDAWQASSLFVNLNCSRSLTPEGNFAETAGPAEGEGKEGRGRGGGGEERRGRTSWHSWRLFGSLYLANWLVLSWEGDKSDPGLFGSQVEGGWGD